MYSWSMVPNTAKRRKPWGRKQRQNGTITVVVKSHGLLTNLRSLTASEWRVGCESLLPLDLDFYQHVYFSPLQ